MSDGGGVGGGFVAGYGGGGDGFGAARDDDFGGAATNAFGGEGDGLQAGRTEAVDGHGGGVHGKAGAEGGDARDVHALLAFGHGAAEDDVVDLLGVDGGHAGERFLDGESGEIVGARGAQRSFVGAAYGSADGRDDYGFGHGDLGGGVERRNVIVGLATGNCKPSSLFDIRASRGAACTPLPPFFISVHSKGS